MKIKRFVCIMLSTLLLAAGLTACSCNDDNITSGTTIKETDIVLFDNGKTDYKIVVPSEAREAETYAAEEAAYFLETSSGTKFETITDFGKKFNKSDKVISIGNTSILEGSGLVIDKTELGDSGYKIKRYDNTIIIAGAQEGYGNGNIYGVYDFLKYEVGYDYYAEDEIKLNGEKKGFVRDFDYTYVPTYNERAITEFTLETDFVYRTRMKLSSPNSDEFGLWGHTNALYILPESMYRAEHPDWYSASGDANGRYQLCFTNEEMRVEYVKRLKALIEEHPDSKFFQLGQEDTDIWCSCDKCAEAEKKYTQKSGVQIAFVNKVIDEIMPWFNEKYPGREIEFSIFAYLTTEKPPVVETAEGYKVAHEDCKLRDNVAVLMAPIRVDWSKPLTDGVNSGSYLNIKQWAAVANHLMVWKYSFYADDTMFVPFNNLNAYKEINDSLREFNIIYMLEEADSQVPSASFDELRIYVQANLMWNGDQTADSLIRKFMQGYYGEAADEMYEYWVLLNTWQETLNGTRGICSGDVWNAPSAKSEYWPHEMLMKFSEALDKAEARILPLKQTDMNRYEKLHERIDKERMLNLYFRLEFYRSNYTNSEYSEMIDLFAKLTSAHAISTIGSASTGQSCSDYIKGLRSKLR